VLCVTRPYVLNLVSSSLFFSFLQELEIGRVLGRGGNCVVNEITNITLKGTKTVDEPSGENQEVDDDNNPKNSIVQDRKYMVTHCRRQDKNCRYTIKRLHDKTREDVTRFANGIIDLAVEARFLSVLRHPNIITLRGVALGSPCDGGFFLVLDRLCDVLTTRLRKWKTQHAGGVWKPIMDRGGKKKLAFYIERCTVAYDLSCALMYMHSLK
jgi:hypothetical protein